MLWVQSIISERKDCFVKTSANRINGGETMEFDRELADTIDEIRIYYIENGDSRGMLSIFHAESKRGKYRKDMIGVIRAFGDDYYLMGTRIKSESAEKTRERLRKWYKKAALNADAAYWDFDAAMFQPHEEETAEYHEIVSSNAYNGRYYENLVRKTIISDYKIVELLTIRRKENNWKHQF